MMYKLTHNQEYTIEILCYEEYSDKIIYNCGFILTCVAYVRANTKRGEKVLVLVQLTVLNKQGYSKSVHVMSKNPY